METLDRLIQDIPIEPEQEFKNMLRQMFEREEWSEAIALCIDSTIGKDKIFAAVIELLREATSTKVYFASTPIGDNPFYSMIRPSSEDQKVQWKGTSSDRFCKPETLDEFAVTPEIRQKLESLVEDRGLMEPEPKAIKRAEFKVGMRVRITSRLRHWVEHLGWDSEMLKSIGMYDTLLTSSDTYIQKCSQRCWIMEHLSFQYPEDCLEILIEK